MCGSYGHPLDTFHDTAIANTVFPYLESLVRTYQSSGGTQVDPKVLEELLEILSSQRAEYQRKREAQARSKESREMSEARAHYQQGRGAAALASLDVSQALDLPGRAKALGERTLARLRDRLAPQERVLQVRGRGLMIGIECREPAIALAATQRMLERGFVLLPSGDRGRVISLTPPLTIGERALFEACDRLAEVLTEPDLVDRFDGGSAMDATP